MSTLRFNDGIEFDTSGKLRVTRRSDGYYVVGDGMLCAVADWKEGQALVYQMKLKVQSVHTWRVNDDASIMCGELINEVLVITRRGDRATLYVNEMYEVQWDVSGWMFEPLW